MNIEAFDSGRYSSLEEATANDVDIVIPFVSYKNSDHATVKYVVGNLPSSFELKSGGYGKKSD